MNSELLLNPHRFVIMNSEVLLSWCSKVRVGGCQRKLETKRVSENERERERYD